MTEQEEFEAFEGYDKYWEEAYKKINDFENEINDKLKRIMKPSKYRRLINDLELFRSDCCNSWIVKLTTKHPKIQFWGDKDISFKGFSPRLEQWSTGWDGDSWNGVLYLRVTKTKWLEIGWSI